MASANRRLVETGPFILDHLKASGLDLFSHVQTLSGSPFCDGVSSVNAFTSIKTRDLSPV